MGEVAAARSSARPIGVGVIGFGWMGRVHSQAYVRVRHHFVYALLSLSSGGRVAMAYDDLKVIEGHEFLQSIAEGHPHGTNLQNAVRAAEVLDALADSAETGSWVGVPAHARTPVTGAWAGRP
jgi:predicted dehydrogenase